MSFIQHHAIVATTWNKGVANEFSDWCETLTGKEQKLIAINFSWVNGYFSVALLPDGSKEGRSLSIKGDELRTRFIERILDDQGGHYCHWDWIEVSFGELGEHIMQGGDSV